MNPADDIHRRTWDQIPWVVNRSADAATRREVEAHVAECASCRAEYECQCRVRDGLLAEPLPEGAAEAALQRLWQRVDQDDLATASRPVPPAPLEGVAARERPAANGAQWTRWLAAAVVVQAVGLVLLADEHLRPPATVTLSSAPAVAPVPALRIAPAPTLTQGDWQALLASERLRVVEVSADGRFYGVVADAGAAPLDATRLARLREHAGLLLVEPVPR